MLKIKYRKPNSTNIYTSISTIKPNFALNHNKNNKSNKTINTMNKRNTETHATPKNKVKWTEIRQNTTMYIQLEMNSTYQRLKNPYYLSNVNDKIEQTNNKK